MDRLLIVLILLVLVLLATSIWVFSKDKNKQIEHHERLQIPKAVFKEDISFAIDVSEDLDPLDYLDEIVDLERTDYDEIVSLELNLDKIGKHQGYFTFLKDGHKKESRFGYEVFDDQIPIIHQHTPIIAKKGSPVNLNDYLRISDNSLKPDETLKVNLDTNVNWDIAGDRVVVVSVTDDAGNRASARLIITIQE